MGRDKTEAWFKQRVFWPGLYKIVERYGKECPECQKVSGYKPARVPLVSMPLAMCLFERIVLDIAGPFSKSNAGYQYIIVIIDYAIRFLDVIPLKNITAPKVAEELIKRVSRVGIPQEILTE